MTRAQRNYAKGGDYESPVRSSLLARKIEIFLDRELDEPADFRDEIHAIRSASPDDEISIYINTPGGRLDTCKAILNSILMSEARITGYLEGTIASAGTIIACACPDIRVLPHTEFMIHSAWSGTSGIIRNNAEYMAFQQRTLEDLMKDVYKDFLTDDELETVFQGREIWMDADEVTRRFKARAEKWKAAREAKENST